MIINADHVRFIPSTLSKTDRQTHLGPPILVRRLPASDDASLCPVAALEALLQRRSDLGIGHSFVFSSASDHHVPISTPGFAELLRT